jgi:hypothetical protein
MEDWNDGGIMILTECPAIINTAGHITTID